MSSLIKKIQEVNFSQYYYNKTLDGLKKVLNYMKDINMQYQLINEKIKEIISFPSELSNNFRKEINDYLDWFKNVDISNKKNYINQFENNYASLKEIFEKYYEKISSTYKNIFFKNISEYNENISKTINDLLEFDPPSINNYSDNLIELELEEQTSDLYYENPNVSKI